MKECYICENQEAVHEHVIGREDFIFCDGCEESYQVAMKSIREARKGLYLIRGGLKC